MTAEFCASCQKRIPRGDHSYRYWVDQSGVHRIGNFPAFNRRIDDNANCACSGCSHEARKKVCYSDSSYLLLPIFSPNSSFIPVLHSPFLFFWRSLAMVSSRSFLV